VNRWLFILICSIMVIISANVVYAADANFAYSGVATYDEQPATMNLAITGTAVTGTLSKPGVCESNIRLTSTTLTLNGALAGGSWEGSGTISGTWTGGDSVCGTQLTIADGYPQQGTFTISYDGSTVQLLRTGAAPLPSGWTYDFGPTGQVYTPPAAFPVPILDYTTTSLVDDNYLNSDRKSAFSITDNNVYTWTELGPVYGGEQVQIIWKDPSGKEYYTSNYVISDPSEQNLEFWETYTLYSYINIAGWDPAQNPGTWTSNIYINGKFLYSQPFTISAPSSGGGILTGLSYLPSSPVTGQDITFTVNTNNPPANPSYSWDMGEAFFDGQPVAWTGEPTFTYNYYNPGRYTVTVQLRDKDNYTTILDEKSWDVVVSE